MIAAGIMHFVNPSVFRNTIWLHFSMPNALMYAIGLGQILIGILCLVSAISGSTDCKRECGCAAAYSDSDVQSMMKRLMAETDDPSKLPDPELVLTALVATQFLKDRNQASLLQYLTIDEAAAEILSGHDGNLALFLRSLSDAAAKALSKHVGLLVLNFIPELSNAAAESLSQHHGNLYLKGVGSLSDAAAESLSRHQHNLSMTQLKMISDEAARSLLKHPDLELDLTIMPESAAMILREHPSLCDLEADDTKAF
jgi:hypothetical protein